MPVPAHVYAVVLIALIAISSAGVLVRGAEEAHPLVVALWRTGAAAALLSPAIRRVSRADGLRIALAGALLAVHFGTWFGSLHLTTVLRSTVLVTLTPIWVGLLEWAVLKAPPARKFWFGVVAAIGGAALMGSGNSVRASLLGDGLALLGGLTGAGYFFLGRTVRERVGIGTYASLVCLAAALSLVPVVAVLDAPVVGFSSTTWMFIAALALGPQLLGHNGINYALGYIPAARLTSVTLLEPVGAALLAWVFLGETPSVTAALGGLLAMAGILVAATPENEPPVAEQD
jgi:drug/metabolite transporter (DMT)-like permease